MNDLLFIARADAGKLELDLADTDLAELAREAVHALLPKAADSSIRLGVRAAEPIQARVDRARIAELLENLISNALVHTPGGTVELRVAALKGNVVLEVADSGIGISAHDQRHLFERFYRSKQTQATPGTGLGLSIVKAIAKAHGGRVSVESREGAGTTFRISLPATAPKQSPRRGAKTPGAA